MGATGTLIEKWQPLSISNSGIYQTIRLCWLEQPMLYETKTMVTETNETMHHVRPFHFEFHSICFKMIVVMKMKCDKHILNTIVMTDAYFPF